MIHDRFEQIRLMLQRNPRCPIETIQRKLGVSRSTARRDLMRLEARGLVVRVHGGAVSPQVLRGDPAFSRRRSQSVGAKRSTAAAAASLAKDGQTVFVDGGTTCAELGRLLMGLPLQIYTNSLPLLTAAGNGRAQIICIGGQVRASSQALVGGLATSWLENLRFDIAFIGASGLSPTDGASTTELTEAAVKQTAMKHAGCSVLLADCEKLRRVAPVRFAAWEAFDYWATDDRPAAGMVRRLREAGVKLRLLKDR